MLKWHEFSSMKIQYDIMLTYNEHTVHWLAHTILVEDLWDATALSKNDAVS